MIERWFADSTTGACLGSYVGPDPVPYPNATEVPSAPQHGAQTWDGSRWTGDPRMGEPSDIEVIREVLKRRSNATDADFDTARDDLRGRRGRR